MQLNWKKIPSGTFGASGEYGYLGKVIVAQAGWNNSRSRNDGPENTHSGQVLLPGFKRGAESAVGASIEDVKASLQAKIEMWCNSAGLVAKAE